MKRLSGTATTLAALAAAVGLVWVATPRLPAFVGAPLLLGLGVAVCVAAARCGRRGALAFLAWFPFVFGLFVTMGNATEHQLLTSGERVTGTVVASRHIDSRKHPHFDVTLAGPGGKLLPGRLSELKDQPYGRQIEVYYDPAGDLPIREAGELHPNYPLQLVPLALGAVCLVGGILLGRRRQL